MPSVTNVVRRILPRQPGTAKTSWLASSRLIRRYTEGVQFKVSVDNETKDFHFKSDRLNHGTLSSLWLRDNCLCPKCINQETMQRNFRIFEHLDVQPMDVKTTKDGLKVLWESPVKEAVGGSRSTGRTHDSFYEWGFLERYLFMHYRTPPNYGWKLWGSEIAGDPPTVDYKEVMAGETDQGLARMMDSIARYGFVFVDNTPFDDAAHTERLLERIGPIRNTHYGGFYDFVPDMAKADTAYSNIALPAHTDTTYFTDPAGLQAFHLLSHTSTARTPEGEGTSGGQSILVDGYRAARILEKEEPDMFSQLKTKVVPWHASGNEGIAITPGRHFPVFEITDVPGEHMVIRWNNDDRGVLPTGPIASQITNWIESAAYWDQILKRPDSEFWFQLKPGRTLIFDNHRVLHGRSAFTGLRRICGGYINRDDWVSRWRNTCLNKREVAQQVVGS